MKYTLHLKNNGPKQANNILVIDRHSPNLTFLGALSDPSCRREDTVRCRGFSLPAGGTKTIDLVFNVNSPGLICNSTITNTARVSSSQRDLLTDNNHSNQIETKIICTPGTTPFPAPECQDGIDNDGDGSTDGGDAQCHTDGNPFNNASYDANDNSEQGLNTECSDGIDNDAFGDVDGADPQCHTDGNAQNPQSYDPSRTSEHGRPAITPTPTVTPTPTATPTPAPTPTFSPTPTPLRLADLGVTKTGPQSVVKGELIQYNIRVQNQGPSNATNIAVTDFAPRNFTFLPGSSSPFCERAATGARCNITFLRSNTTRTLRLMFITHAPNGTCGKAVRNRARAIGSPHDPNFSNNTAAVSTIVQCPQTPTPHPTSTPTPRPSFTISPLPGVPACSDGQDNDGDGRIDTHDPECHKDRNPNNPFSYIPNHTSENSPPISGFQRVITFFRNIFIFNTYANSNTNTNTVTVGR